MYFNPSHYNLNWLPNYKLLKDINGMSIIQRQSLRRKKNIRKTMFWNISCMTKLLYSLLFLENKTIDFSNCKIFLQTQRVSTFFMHSFGKDQTSWQNGKVRQKTWKPCECDEKCEEKMFKGLTNVGLFLSGVNSVLTKLFFF